MTLSARDKFSEFPISRYIPNDRRHDIRQKHAYKSNKYKQTATLQTTKTEKQNYFSPPATPNDTKSRIN